MQSSPSPNKKSIPIQRIAREWALQLLYQLDITSDDLSKSLVDIFCDQMTGLEENLGKKEKRKIINIAESIVGGVHQNLEKIDNTLKDCADNWSLKRMATVDRNILRIAVFEIIYQDDIPKVVSINEAIEIAKSFGGDDSGKFINGILDKINKSTIDDD